MNSFNLFLADGSKFRTDKTLVMGIMNATPDSFSDGGELSDAATIKKRAQQMLDSGADMLDIGGESTRPGHKTVNAKEELSRILPVIKAVRTISKSIPISIDTQKAEVADQALAAGASLLNDVSALTDPKMAAVAKKFGCSIILMRNKPTGSDTVVDCKRQFKAIIRQAEESGLTRSHLLLDPGLGFGDLKSRDYKLSPGSDPHANLLLILNIKKYSHDLPVVIGASRKRFLADITGVEEASERLAGSVAAAVMAQQAGASIVRVHDVAETVKAFRLLAS